MSKLEDLDQGNEDQSPARLIAPFARAGNFPKDPAGRQALIDGLMRAANTTNVPAEQIVARCLEFSEYCPTDHDLLTVAGEIRNESRRAEEATRDQKAEWEKQYGPPDPGWSKRLLNAAVNATESKKAAFQAELNQMRRQAIHDALWYTEGAGRIRLDQIVGRAERQRDKQFWREAMDRDNREYPALVAQIRDEMARGEWIE